MAAAPTQGLHPHWTVSIYRSVNDLFTFYSTVSHYVLFGGRLATAPEFGGPPDRALAARVQVYSLCLELWLWDRPHYRSGTWAEDSVKNLRNVALPGSGVPLSWVASSRILALAFLLWVYPAVALLAALYLHGVWCPGAVACAFSAQLLQPGDWFSHWRLNCRLASMHAALTGAPGYGMENKWAFLTAAQAAGIPVSPWLDTPALVVKDRNEEGGMGIHFFANAAAGGDWILQPRLHNDAVLAALLPPSAPLSTLRVITASTGGLSTERITRLRVGVGTPGGLQEALGHVTALSCVFRAGRAGAATDHSSVLFDVDTATGRIGAGTSNAHWYRLGRPTVSGWTSAHDMKVHPDGDIPVTGQHIPDMPGILRLVREAHAALLPDVPLAGWDVALTPQGRLLLEVNLSCNFFRGSFDGPAYWRFLHTYFSALDALRHT